MVKYAIKTVIYKSLGQLDPPTHIWVICPNSGLYSPKSMSRMGSSRVGSKYSWWVGAHLHKLGTLSQIKMFLDALASLGLGRLTIVIHSYSLNFLKPSIKIHIKSNVKGKRKSV